MMETLLHEAIKWLIDNSILVTIISGISVFIHIAITLFRLKNPPRFITRFKQWLVDQGIWMPKFLGTVQKPSGTSLWEYNKATGQMQLAQFMQKRGVTGEKMLIRKRKHLYVFAMNKNNAARKFARIMKAEHYSKPLKSRKNVTAK